MVVCMARNYSRAGAQRTERRLPTAAVPIYSCGRSRRRSKRGAASSPRGRSSRTRPRPWSLAVSLALSRIEIGLYSDPCYPAPGPDQPDANHARQPAPPPRSRPSRRNGARSSGPVTPEGKARASRNALKHGLCAMQHLVLEGEVPDDLAALIAHLTDEVGAASEIEARLARRLAIAFWKGERAERIEVALFDAAPGSARRRTARVGTGRSLDHLRRPPLQRHPRPAGADRPRDQALPGRAARAAQGCAGVHGRTRGHGRRKSANCTNELMPRHARTRRGRAKRTLSCWSVAWRRGSTPLQRGGSAGSEIGTNPGPVTSSPRLSVIPPRIDGSPNG